MSAVPRSVRVPVEGGELEVAEFGAEDGAAVLAIHGITSSSRAWLALARREPGLRIVAPDLRGRGRSRGLPASGGIRDHARDLVAVLDARGLDRVPVLGHSMGGFVAVALAARAPERVAGLVLIDGGYPLARPEGVAEDALTELVLGPIARRLAQEFPDRESYRDFWRAHPAFGGGQVPDLEAYADYDLAGEVPHLHPSSTVDDIAADALDLYGSPWHLEALDELPAGTPLLRAPRGLLDEPGGLYPALAGVSGPAPRAPRLTVHEVPDTNHYTILLAEPGAGVVAEHLRPLL